MPITNPFDDLAAGYDRNGAHAARAAGLLARADAAFPAGPPAVVLDVATGTGAASFAALARYPAAAITAVDLSAPMIDRARTIAATTAGAERIRWICGDAVPFPADDGSADLVVCSSSLHFFGTGVFADWARVLRPGGVAAYSLPLRSAFRPGARFADLLPAAADRIPLPDSAAEAWRLAGTWPGFEPVSAVVEDGAACCVLRRR